MIHPFYFWGGVDILVFIVIVICSCIFGAATEPDGAAIIGFIITFLLDVIVAGIYLIIYAYKV